MVKTPQILCVSTVILLILVIVIGAIGMLNVAYQSQQLESQRFGQWPADWQLWVAKCATFVKDTGGVPPEQVGKVPDPVPKSVDQCLCAARIGRMSFATRVSTFRDMMENDLEQRARWREETQHCLAEGDTW